MARFIKVKKEWFAVPDDSDNAKIEIKYLTPGQEQDLELEALQVSGQDGGGSEIKFDINKKRRAIVSAVVTDWSGFFARNGKEKKCTVAAVLQAVKEFDWFFDFVETSRETLRTKIEGEEEEAEKN